MEELADFLIVFVGGGLVLMLLALILYVVSEIEHKIDNWLIRRTLRKMDGDKWEL